MSSPISLIPLVSRGYVKVTGPGGVDSIRVYITNTDVENWTLWGEVTGPFAEGTFVNIAYDGSLVMRCTGVKDGVESEPSSMGFGE